MPKDYGKATYVVGRHRKNPVLIHTSRTDKSKVYEFMIASKFKVCFETIYKKISSVLVFFFRFLVSSLGNVFRVQKSKTDIEICKQN